MPLGSSEIHLEEKVCSLRPFHMTLQVNVGGDVLTIDVNAEAGATPVVSTADCCSACRQRQGCNVWTFCPLVAGCDNGCPNYVATCALPVAMAMLCSCYFHLHCESYLHTGALCRYGTTTASLCSKAQMLTVTRWQPACKT